MPGFSAQTQARMKEEQRQRTAAAGAQTATAHGSAAWASPEEIAAAGIFNAQPLLFGHIPQGYLFYNGDGHCLTFGPTGSGKGTSVVVPNLLTYPGSVVCIDPKGAVPAVTAARRAAMGQKVILLDPYAEVERAMLASGQPRAWHPIPRASYNPLSQLDRDAEGVIEDVRLIASGLILGEEGRNRYFSDCARIVLECLLLHLLATSEKHEWTMRELFKLASCTRNFFEDNLLPTMQERQDFDGHVARLAQQIVGYSSEGGAAIWSTLTRSLNLLQTPRLLSALASSDVDFSTLKDTPATVYLVLPASRLHTDSVWLRLMLSFIIYQLSDARQPSYPVLFVVDECAALGRLEMLETAVGLMRGYGLKLWLIFQDLPQLKGIYGERWSSFISNSGVKQFFNVNDTITADFVSGYLGHETRETQSQNVSANNPLGSSNIGTMGRPLLTPDEVRRLQKHEQILFYERQKPILAQKTVYFENDELKQLAAPDPYKIQPQGA